MMPDRARRSQPGRLRSFHVAAPTGGINTIAAGVDMPASDSVYCYNLIAAEYGLRSRLGWREWCTNLNNEQVRTLVPFTGSSANGSNNKLFAVTNSGIWDVTSSSASPTLVVDSGDGWVSGDDAGWGISSVMVSAAGHFLVYCDELNGYWLFSESVGTWVQVTQATNVAWVKNTAYVIGNRVSNKGLTYICITNGTSENTDNAGPSTSAADITDGTAHWQYTPTITGVDPVNFAAVLAWKNRLWFVEKNTAKGWYLDINSLSGTATAWNFGARFQKGGDLRGLYNWTGDAGIGIDDHLVAISGGGDVLIYKGTSPTSVSTFALQGVWFVGAVPAWRRLCTDFGGDLLVMSSLGIMPISRLANGGNVNDSSQYQTAKIGNLFSQMQAETSTVRGWSMRIHPQDSCLMVTVPTSSGQPTTQLVMSLNTQGWFQYRDMPMGVTAEPWSGSLYFGTEDGRVCINDGYVDGVTLADPNTYTPISWSFLTAYGNGGEPNLKQISTTRLRILSQGGGVTFRVKPLYGWNLTEPDAPTGTAITDIGSWDVGAWDTATWGAQYQSTARVFGGSGCDSEVALAVRGTSTSRMTITGMDVSYQSGGLL